MDNETSIRQQVFQLLEKNSSLSPSLICDKLNLPYKKYKQIIKNYKCQFKSNYKRGQGLFRLSFHGVRFWGFGLVGLDRVLAADKGWNVTRSRNRMLVWRNSLGRLEWFETGRINGWVHSPASKGKMLQLLADAFFKTDLVQDINQFTRWAESFKLKGFTMVADTGVRLPYVKIELLKESNGIVATLGDASHRTSLELQVEFPVWGERLELLTNQSMKLIESFTELMRGLSSPRPLDKDGRMIS